MLTGSSAQMLILLHGAAGGLDELASRWSRSRVLWVAVKLAGRKPADDDDDDDETT